MTGVAHLATALYLKGQVPRAPLGILMLAAAGPDLVWAALNLVPTPGAAPIEIARVARPFGALGDLHLPVQPWSHSLAGVLVLGVLLAGLVLVAYRRWAVAGAVLGAALGHYLLDYLVHGADLTVLPAGAGTRVGPPFALDPGDATRGLVETEPLLAFALQAVVVAVAATSFMRAFPAALPRGRFWFGVGMAALAMAPLPLFLPGAATALVTSTSAMVWGALAEIALVALAMKALAARYAGRTAVQGPLDADEAVAVPHVRRLCHAAGALALLVAVLHLGQSMRDGGVRPAAAAASVGLSLVYALLGRRFLRFNPSTLWAAILMALLVSPLVRVALPVGSWALPIAALEMGLGVLALHLVRTLLRRDLLL